MQTWVAKAMTSVRNEWRDAPWFVLLIIAVAAFVGPGLVYAAWIGITGVL